MENENLKKSGRGGARAGAGRKKGGTNKGEHKTGRIVISCLESEAEMIKTLASEEGKNVSQFLIDLVKNR
ncbi:MAG: hypothetical protein PUE30_01545 [Spirochaetia bacterium]|nr:hypothetical protein [Spirochaetia bacterium]